MPDEPLKGWRPISMLLASVATVPSVALAVVLIVISCRPTAPPCPTCPPCGGSGPTTLPTYGYAMNAAGGVTMSFAGSNGLITASGFCSTTNPWAGPTNNLASVGTWVYNASGDCSVTGFVMLAGTTLENSTRLWIFNKSATNITLRFITATANGSRSLVIGSGRNGLYSAGFIPGASNSSACAFF